MSGCTVMSDGYSATTGCLPDTGLPVAALIIGGLIIVAVGLLLWWADRPR